MVSKPVSEEAKKAGHEPTDVNVRVAVVATAAFVGFLLAAAAFVAWLILVFTPDEPIHERRLTAIETETPRPPPPRLYAELGHTLRQVQERARQRLHDYAWMDKEAGIARIPIEKAMELMASADYPQGYKALLEGAPDEAMEPLADAEPAIVIEMTNGLAYAPADATIEAGAVVEWRNVSNVAHTVTADPAMAIDPAHVTLPQGAETFNSGFIQPGQSYRRRFTVPGNYRYFCIPHEAAGMIAELVVRE